MKSDARCQYHRDRANPDRRLVRQDDHSGFVTFPINAHHTTMHNPCAMMPHALTAGQSNTAREIADPINLFDCSPVRLFFE
jgi:hypothetical protein